MDELMEVSFSPIAETGKPLSRCGKCHRFMKYIQVRQPCWSPADMNKLHSQSQKESRKRFASLACTRTSPQLR